MEFVIALPLIFGVFALLLYVFVIAGPKQDRREDQQRRLDAGRDVARQHEGRARKPHSWRGE